MNETTHECPYPGCPTQITRDLYACRPHWYLIERRLRGRIWAAFRTLDLEALENAHEEAQAFFDSHAAEHAVDLGAPKPL